MDGTEPPTCSDINSLFNTLEDEDGSSIKHDNVIKKLQAIRLWQLMQQEELKKQQQTQLALLKSQIDQEESKEQCLSDEEVTQDVSKSNCNDDDILAVPLEDMTANRLDTILELSSEIEQVDQGLFCENCEESHDNEQNEMAVTGPEEDLIENAAELDCDVESSFEKVSSQLVCFDDIPVSGAGSKKTFEELLEEQIKTGEKSKVSRQSVSSTPKRSFLRKGQGIARFNGPPVKSKRQPSRIDTKQSKQNQCDNNVICVLTTKSQVSKDVKSDGDANFRYKQQEEPLTVNSNKSIKPVVRKTARIKEPVKELLLKPQVPNVITLKSPEPCDLQPTETLQESIWSDVDDSIITLDTTGIENLGPLDFDKLSNETFEQVEKFCNLRYGSDEDEDKDQNHTEESSNPPPSKLMQSLFPALHPVKLHKPPVNEASMPSSERGSVSMPKDSGKLVPPVVDADDSLPPSLLKNKLEEMEKEIKRFQEETSKLSTVRMKEEQELSNLKQEFENFQKQKEEELKNLEEFKKIETKKLKKERKLFEEHVSALKALPNKKDREYIQELEKQITELQEDFKTKEQRLVAVANRLRSQLDSVNKENTQLKTNLKNLQQKLNDVERDKESKQSKKTNAVWKAINDIVDSTTIDDVDQDVENHMAEDYSKPSFNSSRQQPMYQKRNALTDKNANHVSNNADVFVHKAGKVERKLQDGSAEICFSNGTQKLISSDGSTVQIKFANGDFKTILADGTVTYVYTSSGTRHVTHPNGMQIIEFSNKQVERHFPDGSKHVSFTDGSSKMLKKDGTEETIFPDGTVMILKPNGVKTIEFSNGQREIHTSEYKRREYPDGTYKTVFQDGHQETRYSSGRLRIKDANGVLLVDRMATDSPLPIT